MAISPKRFALKSILFASSFLVVLSAFGSAHAQALYQPYYYVVREQYQSMRPNPPPVQPVPPNYPPDERLNAKTNQVLAQGNPPPKPPQPKLVPIPSTLPLTTLPGIDVGLQGGYYDYRSKTNDVNESGYKVGFTGSATETFGQDMFGTIDFRYALGSADYTSTTGKLGSEDDQLWEFRATVGRDFVWRDLYDISPYIGLGYRHHYNDGRGTTSLGDKGYERFNDLFYAPIGVKPRIRIDSETRLSGLAEFDFLFHGSQESDLSQAGFRDPNITAQQDSGLGVRGELMWDTGTWSIGPYVYYWSINNSKVKDYISPGSTCGGTSCTFSQPQNNTAEYGLQFRYHFPAIWRQY